MDTLSQILIKPQFILVSSSDHVLEITHGVSLLQIIARIVTLNLHPGEFFLVLLALSEALYEETVLAGKCHHLLKEEGQTLSLTFWKLKIL